jgi:hypothetical protein
MQNAGGNMKFEINNGISGEILFSLETENIKLCLEAAVKSNTDLHGAYLHGADLRGADLRGADLRGADLRGADLRGADLHGADLGGAYLGGADLRGAYLGGADLHGADLRGADLHGAYLHGAYLGGADLRGADLRGAYLRGADLRGADLRGADLRGAKITDNITVMQSPICIEGLEWFVTIWDNHMQIGCEFHSHDEWIGFDDATWIRMGGKEAAIFKKENMPSLKLFCRLQSDKANKSKKG